MSTESETTPLGMATSAADCSDAVFTDAQCARLQELKAKRPHLSRQEISELEQLLEADFEAAIARSMVPAGDPE